MKKRLLMAMSGGIDSGVSALLLRDQYELVGCTFLTGCSAEKDEQTAHEARQLADNLNITHIVVDVKQLFRKTVINNFIDEYLHGRTPNPCVVCNKAVKFGYLFDVAAREHCDFVATGHYAQIASENGRFFIRKGADTAKDQSYFLWSLPQQSLRQTLFPLGNLTKAQVRQLAAEAGFTKLAQKTESQEICFIPDNNYRQFLEQEVPNFREQFPFGNFVDKNGKVLGQHKGLPNYTIGQRKGLGIALGEPAYVVDIQVDSNEVVLGTKADLLGTSLHLRDVNFMKLPALEQPLDVDLRIRYRSRACKATLFPDNQEIRVLLHEPIDAITPGQSAVFYHGDDLLGGGVII